MKTNGRKRYYAVLLLFSGGALFVDRCVMSRGVTMPDAALAVAATGTDSPAKEVLAIPEVPFPHAVAAYRTAVPVRDLFLPPSLRDGGNGADNLQPRPGGKKPEAPAASAMFADQHGLDGVLIDEGLRIAIVDGQWMRAGQNLGGCTLQEIKGNSATFECSDGTATLQTIPVWNAPGG